MMMKKLVSKENGEHYAWGDGCDGWHLVKTPGMSVIQERMPPGCSETRHFHQHSHQFFFILSGEATNEVGGEILRAKPGEGCSVVPTVGHVIRNEGKSDLLFLLVSTPPSHGDRVKIEEMANKALLDTARKLADREG
jgi:mannose-6-phosphate isomerase-like protein (cupin superfamily)